MKRTGLLVLAFGLGWCLGHARGWDAGRWHGLTEGRL